MILQALSDLGNHSRRTINRIFLSDVEFPPIAPTKTTKTSTTARRGIRSKTVTQRPEQYKVGTKRAENGRFVPTKRDARISSTMAEGNTKSNASADHGLSIGDGLDAVEKSAHIVDSSPSSMGFVTRQMFDPNMSAWPIPRVFKALKRRLGADDQSKCGGWITWLKLS